MFLWRQLLEMNAGCSGASRKTSLQMADLLFFWILYYRRTGIRKYLDLPVMAAEPGTTAGGEPSPPRVVSYPGLYVGAAGCGSSLLRAYAALTGKKLTNLYEYHFLEKI